MQFVIDISKYYSYLNNFAPVALWSIKILESIDIKCNFFYFFLNFYLLLDSTEPLPSFSETYHLEDAKCRTLSKNCPMILIHTTFPGPFLFFGY